MNSRIY